MSIAAFGGRCEAADVRGAEAVCVAVNSDKRRFVPPAAPLALAVRRAANFGAMLGGWMAEGASGLLHFQLEQLGSMINMVPPEHQRC